MNGYSTIKKVNAAGIKLTDLFLKTMFINVWFLEQILVIKSLIYAVLCTDTQFEILSRVFLVCAYKTT